jgi:hypothetical protein
MRRTQLRTVTACVSLTAICALGFAVVSKSRFVHDEASRQKVLHISENVREFYRTHGRCPSEAETQTFSLALTGVGLCPGVEALPCLRYYTASEITPGCIFRYPVRFDDYFTYLVVQERWLSPDEFDDFRSRLSKVPTGSIQSWSITIPPLRAKGCCECKGILTYRSERATFLRRNAPPRFDAAAP